MEIMACPGACDSTGQELESNDVVIDVPLVMEPVLWPGCCIYRVPKNLRKVNKEAYTPNLVSIGPFHQGEDELRDMEMHKLRYLKDFLYRTGTSQEDLLKIIQENEVKIRHCYSKDCTLSSTDFVKMILLDAIFIIELFLRFSKYVENDENDENDENELFQRTREKENDENELFQRTREKENDENDENDENELFQRTREKENDYISSQPWLDNAIRQDLILLENQLPFFVLEELYTFAFSDSSNPDYQIDFLVLSVVYFASYIGREIRVEIEQQKEFNIEKVEHFTDLIRSVFCSVPNLKPLDCAAKLDNLDKLDCATKLDEAGLKFNGVEKRSLLHITFTANTWLKDYPCFNLSWLLACLPCLKSAFPPLERMQCILEVPTLMIYDCTEAVFRNLMALEQCHYPLHTYICNYVCLMDCLIDTEKDVELLVEKKVIVNNIGSNTAAMTLFNKLGIEIGEGESCYYHLGQQMNLYLDNHWNRIMASMKSTYFRDFWRGTATVIGLTVLGITFVNFLRPFVMKI